MLLLELLLVIVFSVLLIGGEFKGVECGGISKIINSNFKFVMDNSCKIDMVNIYLKEMFLLG